MKVMHVAIFLAVAASSLAIDVRLNSQQAGNGFGPNRPAAQFPGAPQQMAPQQAAPKQAAPQQPGFQQPGGLFGMGGFNLNNIGNLANKFVGDTPAFDDIMSKAKQAPAVPAAVSKLNGAAAPAALAAAPQFNAGIEQKNAPVIEAPARIPLMGGFNNAESCDRLARNPFANLGQSVDILKSFVDNQATGATTLAFYSSQVVAGINHKAVFSLNGNYFGVFAFLGLNGAAPVIKQFVFGDSLDVVLKSLNLEADAKLNLNCKSSDLAPRNQPQVLAAPQAAGNQAQPDNAVREAALNGLGFNAPASAQPLAFQAPQQQANFQAPQQQANFQAPQQVAQKPQANIQARQQQLNFQAPQQQVNFQAQASVQPAQGFVPNQQAFGLPAGPRIINIGTQGN